MADIVVTQWTRLALMEASDEFGAPTTGRDI